MGAALEQMLDNLRKLTEVEELEFNEDGRLELVFDNAMPLDIVKIENDHVMLTSPLHDSPSELSFKQLAEYLQGNYFGDATGHGRIVYDRESDSLVLQDIFDPALFDMKRLEARVIDFVKYASFWLSYRSSNGEDADEDEGRAPAPSGPSDDEFIIRG